jgi:8-oxo-dGTP pyrophosphatase MutT (NUDIX family)
VRWQVHGERPIYESEWVRLVMVDVEIPGERRFDHHVVRLPRQASGTVIRDPERGYLLLWRHRFVTDTWGWEIPAGMIDHGETPEEAARREALEETGWQPGPLRRLFSYHPNNGLTDQRFHIFLADSATRVGEPTDPSESERVEWLAPEALRRAVQDEQIGDGLSVTALLWMLAFEP